MEVGWDIWLMALGLTAILVLFMGPAMWSTDTETIWTRLWRRIRGKEKPLTEAEKNDRDRY